MRLPSPVLPHLPAWSCAWARNAPSVPSGSRIGNVALSAALALAALVVLPLGTAAQTTEQADSAAQAARRSDGLPLIATRTLDFTTDRGSWLHLDLSPDGGTLVFELLGDLYTLPVTGGEATRITEGQGYDMQPRFSADGSRIVFVSDRNGSENLWIANADGTGARALTEDERTNHMSPEWAPEGDYLVSVKGSDLWLYHVDGGSGVQLTGHEDGDPAVIGPAFGADDGTIWVNVRGSLGGGFPVETAWEDAPAALHGWTEQSSPRQVDAFQVARLDRDSGRLEVRTQETFGAFRPVASPDGRWLVYVTRYDDREGLRLLDLETNEVSWLRMDVQRDDHQGGGMRDRDVYPGSAFTPDSDALITTWDGRIWRVEVPSGEATEVPFTARVEQELGPLVDFDYAVDDDELTVSQIRGARPSPDGTRFAFTALDRLYTATLPAAPSGRIQATPGEGAAEPEPLLLTEARPLTGRAPVEHAPVWSPDGRWIAYVTWDDSVGGDIWRVRSDGSGDPERLTPESAFYEKLNFNGDGTRLLAVRGSKMHRMKTLEDFGRHSGAAELEYVWLPAEGGEPTRIAWVGGGPSEESRAVPHSGPDPDRVYVWAGSDGLLSMRYDGTDLRTVVKVTAPRIQGPGSSPTPDEVILSPDGTRAIVRASRNVWLITVPRVGGEAPEVSVTGSSMPARRLTRIGGDFVGWRPDGQVAHWSIGRSFFQYDVPLADSLVADSVATARAEAGREPAEEEEPEEEAAEAEEEESRPAYEPYRADLELVLPKDKPTGVMALTGARLITMRGSEVIERGDLVVRDNRIEAVGPSGSVDIPADARVFDMSGKTIYPGLVDIHAHTWVAWGVHRNQISQFLAQLAYGVTTQRDPQTSSADVVTYADRMAIGDLIGPRIYSTGPGIFGADDIDSLDEARDVLRRYSEHFNTLTIKQYLAGDRKVRQWVITAARELGLTPTTEGGSNFTMNLTLMQDGYSGLEHSLPISPFYDDVVELGAFSGLTYTPTFIVAYGGPSGRQYYLTHEELNGNERLQRFTPGDEIDKWRATQWYRDDQYVHFLHAEQLEKWMDAGGKAGLGSHGEVQGIGTHWELWMMAAGGMDPHRALQMATLMSADAIGLDGDLGSLEPGKLADLQVLDRNPLEDLRNTTSISHVMKNGRLFEADDLTEIWPRQRALPTQWWWRVEPPGVERGGG